MKHNTSKRGLAVLLLLCISAGLSSCASSSGQESKKTADTDVSGTAAVPEQDAEEDYYRNIRTLSDNGINYDGYEFTVMRAFGSDNWDLYIAPEQITGEKLNDAAFTRNTEVEELLNVKICLSDKGSTDLFRNTVLAGDGEAFDLAALWVVDNFSGLLTDGTTFNWRELPHVVLTEPWYNQTANENFFIADAQRIAVTDITYTFQQHYRLLYNKKLGTTFGLEAPYNDVFAGTWTYDRLLSMIRGVYADLNGNGKADEEDRYGFGVNQNHMFYGFGEFPIRVKNSQVELNLISERFTDIVDLLKAENSNPDIYIGTPLDMFSAGNALFMGFSSDPKKLRDVPVDFSYLPFPKYDENQEAYSVFCSGGLTVIPSCAPDPGRTGAVIEALAAGSAKYLVDAYVEDYIESKVLRDEDSVKVYRMMRSLEQYSFAYNLSPAAEFAKHGYYETILTKSADKVASYAESTREKLETAFEKFLAAAADVE